MGSIRAYLAGPMFSMSRESAEGWRETAAQRFQLMGIDSISPTYRWDWPCARIVRADLRDIQRASFVFAHVPLGVPMYGTPIELFYAYSILQKPVYAFGHDKGDSSPWLIMNTTYLEKEYPAAMQHVEADLIELRKLAGE